MKNEIHKRQAMPPRHIEFITPMYITKLIINIISEMDYDALLAPVIHTRAIISLSIKFLILELSSMAIER
jgi:hypothetical protein